MSSDPLTSIELLILTNYISVAIITAVSYDYMLSFSREIEYIWCKPWTWVSTMFVVVRYIGLFWIITGALYGRSFIPGPVEVNVSTPIYLRPQSQKRDVDTLKNKGRVLFLIYGWAFVAFLSATDLVMILRVYAMWNRSKRILYILLFIYIPQSIIFVVFNGIYNSPNANLRVTIGQVLAGYSICNVSYINTPSLDVQVYRVAPRLVLSAVLIIFAVLQTLKQSFEMYKATKQWQLNRYMQKLVGDGILYFVANVLYQIYDILIWNPSYTASILLNTLPYLVLYTLVPRFIISIRELYDRDVRDRFHIDTGFGVQSRSNAGQGTTVSAMVFVDGNQGPEVAGGTTNSDDVELGRVHVSGLNEDSPIGGSE